MTIGIDCRLWNESGVGRYIRNLVEHLAIIDRKNSYVLFVLGKDLENIKYQIFLRSRISLRETNIKNNWNLRLADAKWHTIEEQIKFPQVLNRENLDLVHFPYISVPIFYNKPFVVTIHDLIPYHFSTGEASTLVLPLYYLKHLGYKLVISQAAKRAKKIITVSNATKREIVDHLGVDKEKVIVTYEGVSSNLKSQNSNPQLKSQNYFLYVGNAYPHKNLERLIEAFNLICHPELVSGSQSNRDSDFRQNDTRVVLVGREDYFYKRLKEKVKDMGLEKNVKFLGEVSDEELSGLYKNARCLIMPSVMEGFGLPVLEAMANKCLALASDIPSLREICGSLAIYFDPYNASDMYRKMKEVHSNDINHYSENIAKGYERAKMFSWKKMAKDTLEVYKQSVTCR